MDSTSSVDVEITTSQNERTRLIPKSSSRRVLYATLISVWGTLSFGYCLGYSSPASYDLQSVENSAIRLNNSQQSWFSSWMAIGALIGCFIGGRAVDVIGRKFAIIVGAIPLELGWLLIFFAKNRMMLYSGRIITGVGCGIEALAVAVYVAEISLAHQRGLLGAVNQLAVITGIILGYLLGYFFYWDWLALLACIPPAVLFVLMPWMPGSPRWYLKKNRRDDAVKSLLWLRGSQTGIEDECNDIEATLESHRQIDCQEFVTAPVAKPILISVILLALQQVCGINAVMFNAAGIFSKAGLGDPKLASLPVSIVQLLGTIMTCFLVDRIGRRILLWTNALGMAASLIGLGVYFQIYENTADISWLAVLTSVLFSFFFSAAWGPVPWVVMSEIIPLRARGVGTSLATMTCWVMFFLVTKTYVTLESAFGNQGVCWFYAGFNFAAFVYVFVFVPETKGRTLEEIELSFRHNS
ncbi:hypothetical protein ACROYT_G032986 [Oculina patagonica]